MPHRENKPATPPNTGYSDAVKSAVQETTQRVREMHGAIAGQSFALLQKIPLIATPAQWVQGAHDAISAGVYAAVHHGTAGLCEIASVIENNSVRSVCEQPPSRLASGLRSALNGAFGDHFAASNNRLAIRMALHLDGLPLALERSVLAEAFPDAGRKICLFIHGLSCDEHCWQPAGATCTAGEPDEPINFGEALRAQYGLTPLYLRYNTGLPIADNGEQLARLLDELLKHWPLADAELFIVGHSMGGLVALNACEQAGTAGLAWTGATRALICLGSPHLGSPVERLGHFTTSALNLSSITAPLGSLAATRSQGIKDLRHGPGAARACAQHAHIAYRFLGASLAEDTGHPFGAFLGDGLVTLSSATAHAIEGDVQSALLGGIGHMGLLTDPRVYRQIVAWLNTLP